MPRFGETSVIGNEVVMSSSNVICHVVLSVTAFFLGGCGQQAALSVKTLSPKASAQKALEKYDANQDGALDQTECSAGLRALFPTSDEDQNGKLSLEEIQKRLQFHDDQKVGLITSTANLTSSGTSVEGLLVKLIPDPVFTGLPSAKGSADKNGFVVFQSDGESIPGVRPGVYSIVIIESGEERNLNTGIEIGQTVNRGTPEINIDQ